MKVMRKIVKIDEEKCDGCGFCVPACAEGAIKIVDGKARLVSESFCDGLGACLGECPNGAISIEEREAEEFDERAVEEYLSSTQEKETHILGCPHSQKVLEYKVVCEEEGAPLRVLVRQWPIKIDLVPADAPFLKDSQLLVVADCVPVAYPSFHRDFLGEKAILLGCPKFGDTQRGIQKFIQIFKQNHIKGIQVVRMEVPCCGALPVMLKRAMSQAGKNIPMEEVVVGTKGEIISRADIP
ncbi:MAG: ATP-binding protein [Desulfatiglandales bacterium]